MSEPVAVADGDLERFGALSGLVRQGIEETYLRARRDGGKAPATYVYASQWSECTRQMALNVAWGHEERLTDPDVLARMARGSERAQDVRSRLAAAGKGPPVVFTVEGDEQRFELKGRNGKVALAGKTDFSIKRGEVTARVEVKAFHPNLTERLKAIEDFDRSPWTRKAPYQLLAYLLGSNTRFGYLLMDRHGLPRLIEVDLYGEGNLAKAEDFLTRAEEASEAGVVFRESGDEDILPAHCADAEACLRCPWFKRRCQPPIVTAAPVLSVDEDLLTAERTYWDTKDAADKHEDAKEALKEWAKKSGAPVGVVGGTVFQAKRYTTTSYSVPAEVRAPYKKEVEACRVTLTRPESNNPDD